MGKLAADAGRLHRAARLWGAADVMDEAYGAHLTKGGRAILDYEAQLELDPAPTWEPVWRTEWAEGRRMTTDQAVAYALDPESIRLRSRPTSPPEGLTAREMDVLRLVARGLTSADVGRQLFLSPADHRLAPQLHLHQARRALAYRGCPLRAQPRDRLSAAFR